MIEIHPTADELRLIRALAMETVVWDIGERLAPGSSHSVAAYFRMREAWADLLKTRSVPEPSSAEGSPSVTCPHNWLKYNDHGEGSSPETSERKAP